MQAEISTMREELSSLRSENKDLKATIVNNDGTRSASRPATLLSSSSASARTHTSNSDITTSSVSPRIPHTVDQSAHDQKQVSSDGLTTASYKRHPKKNNRKSIVCTGANNTQIAIRSAPKKAIFVTRLAPDTTHVKLNNYLATVMKIKNSECTRLKTRFNTYSSFHISIDEQDIEKIMDPEAWPVGILISQFHGPLKDEQKYSDLVLNANSDSIASKNGDSPAGNMEK